MILIFSGAFFHFWCSIFFFPSTVYHWPETDSIKFLNPKIPRQCSIFCSCCKKDFCIFNKEWNFYEPLYILSDQLFNVHYYYIRTSSCKWLTRKSLSDEGCWQPRPQRPDSQLSGKPLPPAAWGPAPGPRRRDLSQEPGGLCWVHFVSPRPSNSSSWLQRGSPWAGKENSIWSEPQSEGSPGVFLDQDLLQGQ